MDAALRGAALVKKGDPAIPKAGVVSQVYRSFGWRRVPSLE
jgi:hypothetical protein